MDRENFAQRQAEMSANWYEGVKRREGNVDAYIIKRHHAYLDRWKEAGRFIADGAKVLDIGGGNLYPLLLEYIKSKNIDYHYLDIDAAAVEGSRKLGESFGFNPKNFSVGFNDQLGFESEKFDCVFSSHCIEHSINLEKTFTELNRILRPEGLLLMAVPFGWEVNPEHPYFFGPDQWIALVEDAGFEICVAQIGRVYPEHGCDFFIAAKKIGAKLNAPRINADDYRKENYQFLSYDNSCIAYSGDMQITHEGNAAHLRGNDWSIEIALPTRAKTVLPILLNHSWSAQIQIFTRSSLPTYHDLFSWFPYVQPCRHEIIKSKASKTWVVIKPTGNNAASRSTEGVLYGVMYK